MPANDNLELIERNKEIFAQYLIAIGCVAHYIRQVEEFQSSQTSSTPLPARWMHLAERSLLHRPIPLFSEFCAQLNLDLARQPVKMQQFDDQIRDLRDFIKRHAGELPQWKNRGNPHFTKLVEMHRQVLKLCEA